MENYRFSTEFFYVRERYTPSAQRARVVAGTYRVSFTRHWFLYEYRIPDGNRNARASLSPIVDIKIAFFRFLRDLINALNCVSRVTRTRTLWNETINGIVFDRTEYDTIDIYGCLRQSTDYKLGNILERETHARKKKQKLKRSP